MKKKKESSCNLDISLIPRSRRASGEGNGNPLPYSCLENLMDGGSWQTTVLGVAVSNTRVTENKHIVL